ncbi:MAG: hypothetical protein JWO10_1826 [Microbacteriaceae bacterium]|nr:hypothetical protein [Microbacteriaceae bacterium]
MTAELVPETATSRPYTDQEVIDIALKHRNWGRWGAEDERGALNLIDADKVRRAAALVRRGAVFSCGLPYDVDGPQPAGALRNNPIHTMLMDGGDVGTPAQPFTDGFGYADDAIYMPLQSGTQWDAFAHVFFDHKMYNGYPTSDVTSRGAARNSIDKLADRVVSRGILVDIPRLLGVPWLLPGEGVTGEMFEESLKRSGLTTEPGDILLVRTGSVAWARDQGALSHMTGDSAPGLTVSAAEWLCDHDIAVVAVDNFSMEVLPSQTPEMLFPVHIILNVHAGMLVGEFFDLDELAADCAEDGVYEFLFVGPPLAFTGAVGSPLNPVVIK